MCTFSVDWRWVNELNFDLDKRSAMDWVYRCSRIGMSSVLKGVVFLEIMGLWLGVLFGLFSIPRYSDHRTLFIPQDDSPAVIVSGPML